MIRSLALRRAARCCLAITSFVVGCGTGATAGASAIRGETTRCAQDGEQSAELVSPTGTLHGTLRLPASCGRVPLALLIAGSGPTDRNGNAPQLGLHTDAYRKLANALAEHGVASLRYDKRGVARSAGAAARESDLRLDTYADDAAAWLAQLKEDPRFAQRIVVGHSEGSLLGMLAAQREPVAALVSVAGPARGIGKILREQLARQLPAPLLPRAQAILGRLEMGEQVADVPAALSSVFRPSVQPFLISWLAYEPAAEIAKLRIPTLIVQGTHDVQVPSSEADGLARARPDASVLRIEGMTHVLTLAASDSAAQQAAYRDPSLPLAPALIDGLAQFIERLGR